GERGAAPRRGLPSEREVRILHPPPRTPGLRSAAASRRSPIPASSKTPRLKPVRAALARLRGALRRGGGRERLGGRGVTIEAQLARILDLFEEHVYAGEITPSGSYVDHASDITLASLLGGDVPEHIQRG